MLRFLNIRKIFIREKVTIKDSTAASYKDVSYREKPDADVEKRIDAHELFSLFTGNMIKHKRKWFR